jgi:hypothetical protein
MNITREDVLRELELLPVWKLRVPITKEIQTEIKEEVKAEVNAVANTETHAEILPIDVAESTYLCTISSDKNWAFVWPASLILSTSQSTLFNNMLVALKVTKSQQSVITSVEDVSARVIVLMGEIAAQKVLSTTEPLETLRGKAHQINNMHAIATYHPNDILHNLPFKRKTWEDLCLAMEIVNT